MRILLMLCCVLVLRQSNSETWLEWAYPYNGSNVRVYTAELATIKSVSETDTDYIAQPGETVVEMHGQADDATIIIQPLHPTCWRLDMSSDYSLLRKHWRSVLPCYRVYGPIVLH